MNSVITFIIPAFNAEKTIEASIRSLQAQSDRDWTLVVVDDGSADGTSDIVKRLASEDARIGLVQQENAGAGAARNRALITVTSELVGFLDADDQLVPQYLDAMRCFMKDRPGFDIYSCDGLFLLPDGRTAPVFGYGRVVSVTLDLLLRECLILIGGAIVRRDCLEKLGGFREDLYGEDYDFWLRALAAGYRHVATPELLYLYDRSVPGQKSDDSQAGRESALCALSDLVDSGLLTEPARALAMDTISINERAKLMDEQRVRLETYLERRLGRGMASGALSCLRAFAWVVRPARRMCVARTLRRTRT